MEFCGQCATPDEMVQIIYQSFPGIAMGNIILRLIVGTDFIIRRRIYCKSETTPWAFINIKKFSAYRMIFYFQGEMGLITIANGAYYQGFRRKIHQRMIDSSRPGGIIFLPGSIVDYRSIPHSIHAKKNEKL